MTKQILILAYILTVLVISSLVRADSFEATNSSMRGIIQAVEVDQVTGVINVHGELSTLCQTNPAVVVSQINRTKDVILFDVTTSNRSAGCENPVAGEFDASFDLKDLPLDPGVTYFIAFNNYTGQAARMLYTAPQSEGTFEPYKVNKQSLKGTLVYYSDSIADNPGFAIKSGEKIVPVFSPNINLNAFQNREVWVSGYAISTVSLDGASNDSLAPSSQDQTVVVPESIGTVKP